MRTCPPIFANTTEPLDADDWIHTIEDILVLVNCTDDHEKVMYDSHCLRGTARAWWDGFKIMKGEMVITWTAFKDGLCATHIPPRMMAIKKQWFHALKQGSGSIKEYLQKFNLLSRYAPDDVSIEAAKV
ncbi:putative gag-protein [Hordeum vulgare]|nr:putative gag-protein [Hordeum vulgare]